jgi:hypothetical protein
MKTRLDSRSAFPEDMENYLEFNGWHFNKKMCQWAVSKMYKKNGENKEFIEPYTLESLKALSDRTNVKFELDYDAVYIANMCKADFLGSSIQNETQLVRYVKDVIEDPDGYEGLPFTRFYADCIGSGTSIPWGDLL